MFHSILTAFEKGGKFIEPQLVRFCGLYEGPPNLLAFNVKQCVLRTRIRRDSLCRFNDTWPLQITLKKDLEPFPVREEMRILGRQTQTDDQIYLQNKTLEFRSCYFTMDIWIQVYMVNILYN